MILTIDARPINAYFFDLGALALCDPVAQLVEQLTFNQWVGRSNRPGITILIKRDKRQQAPFFIKIMLCGDENLFDNEANRPRLRLKRSAE